MGKDKPILQNIQTPINANLFKLNASSCQSSTPGISNSEPKGQLIEFQEFQQPLKKKTQFQKQLNNTSQLKRTGPFGLRNLTIHIEENFASSQPDFINQGTQPNATQFNRSNLIFKMKQELANASHTSSLSQSSNFYKEQLLNLKRQTILQPLSKNNVGSQRMSSSSQRKLQTKASSSVRQCSSRSSARNQSQSENIQKIERLTSRVLAVEQKIFYYKDLNKRLLKQNEQYNNIIQKNDRDAKKMQLKIRKKQQQFYQQRKRSQALMKKVVQLEREKQMMLQNQSRNFQSQIEKQDLKLKQKDQHIKEMTKKNQKLQNINKALQKELRENDKKIVEMEKQMHKSACNNFMQSITRLKQPSLKFREISSNANKQNQHNNVSIHQNNTNSNQQRKSLQIKKNTGVITKTNRKNSSNGNLLVKKLGQTHSNCHLK